MTVLHCRCPLASPLAPITRDRLPTPRSTAHTHDISSLQANGRPIARGSVPRPRASERILQLRRARDSRERGSTTAGSDGGLVWKLAPGGAGRGRSGGDASGARISSSCDRQISRGSQCRRRGDHGHGAGRGEVSLAIGEEHGDGGERVEQQLSFPRDAQELCPTQRVETILGGSVEGGASRGG